MTREYPRLPEEEARNINQVTDPKLARLAADIEKPIRDMARDPNTHPKLRKLKPLLDKEAERIAEAEVPTKKEFVNEELLRQSVYMMWEGLPDTRAKNDFSAAMAELKIKTIEDLMKVGFWRLVAPPRVRNYVKTWLTEHGIDPFQKLPGGL
jgi:hypothetical protein